MRSIWVPAIAVLMFSGAAFAEEAHHPAGATSATPAPEAAGPSSAMKGSGMGSGMMQGGMMGMMHGGQAGAGMAGCPLMTGGDLALNVEKARSLVTAHLVMMGNDRLRVGSVQAQGDDFVAQIETVDGSLVNRLTIDGKTGAMRPAT
jgi:hypothetical protein